MIPQESRKQIVSELVALGGTPEQVEQIGNILFAVAALDPSRDTDYLLDAISHTDDDLIKSAANIILNGLLS